ncbi:MAG: DUF2075 domain-containing protein [Pyrinomonadaceae bacterium]
MARFLYGAPIPTFFAHTDKYILGSLLASYSNQNLAAQQTFAWQTQLPLLRQALSNFGDGHLFLEFSIPRMGKRADAILVIDGLIVVLEFKMGESSYLNSAIDQVVDYALDLKNFHEGSHLLPIVPILVASEAEPRKHALLPDEDMVYKPLLCNSNTLKEALSSIVTTLACATRIQPMEWAQARYKPTPTIIQAAQALYEKHSVADISRSEAGAINLAQTSDCINQIIHFTEQRNEKSIVFLTGVPGSGKTLAGLNIATQNMAIGQDHSVFLSGNGPLVEVLQEALAEDLATQHGTQGRKNIGEARRRTRTFIQNIHHFRDSYLDDLSAPADRIVVFDEAQRAWTKEELSRFMRQKKGRPDFDVSEPHFLLEVMNRHESCTILCLVGGGQEINRGEAGIDEWVESIWTSFPHWKVYYSSAIVSESVYLHSQTNKQWILDHGEERDALHLKVSLRSFRSEKLAAFVEAIIENRPSDARSLYEGLRDQGYPIVLSRSLEQAKNWLKIKARGSERYGLVAASGAQRLKKFGIWVKSKIDAADWFLKPASDIRSSLFLEETATEFDIQGLELDWLAMCWDADFFYKEGWQLRKFRGTIWEQISDQTTRRYLINAYRVLLTRARQGMVIFVPFGDTTDSTRLPAQYDGTFEFLRSIGIPEL